MEVGKASSSPCRRWRAAGRQWGIMV